MKQKRIRRLGLLLLMLLLTAGCGAAASDSHASRTEETQSAEQSQIETITIENTEDYVLQEEYPAEETEAEMGEGPEEAVRSEAVRIALIDTGIAKSAVNSEHVLPGWNYCSENEDTEDTIGHGTSLAGMILGSEPANLPGGAPEAYIVPLVCQKTDAEGNLIKSPPELLARMIRDAVSVYGCRIISISAGVKQDYKVLREAVEYADEAGALIVASAGNEGNADIYYPGGYEAVLCVGSSNAELTGRSDFSQDNETVDLLAPGEDILVTTMKGNAMKVSGTSYSAAYITAKAAALWQKNPEKTAREITALLMEQ